MWKMAEIYSMSPLRQEPVVEYLRCAPCSRQLPLKRDLCQVKRGNNALSDCSVRNHFFAREKPQMSNSELPIGEPCHSYLQSRSCLLRIIRANFINLLPVIIFFEQEISDPAVRYSLIQIFKGAERQSMTLMRAVAILLTNVIVTGK